MKHPSSKRPPRRGNLFPVDSVGRLVSSWRSTRPDLDMEPVEVIQRLGRLMRHLQTASDAVFARYDLSAPGFAVLVTLVRLEQSQTVGVSQRRLIDELALTAGTMSVRIDRLESQGLVQRQPDPADKRNTFIRLTARGRKLFERGVPEHLANERRLLAALDTSEQRQLTQLLSRLLVEFEGSSCGDDGTPPLGLVLLPAHTAMAMRHKTGRVTDPCLLVQSVCENSAAAQAGIQPGDRLVRAGGQALLSITGLYAALDEAAERGRLRVRLQRLDRTMDVVIRLPPATHPARYRPATRGRTPHFEHLI